MLKKVIPKIKIQSLLRESVVSYDRYNNKQLLALDRRTVSGFKSWPAKEHFTFSQWLAMIHSFTVIKVEGLEDNPYLVRLFQQFKIKDIHLFHSVRTDYSFGWHHDSVNVYLYVVKGKKRVSIKNKTFTVTAGQGIFIPRRHKHRVFNYKNTWALSIGLK